MSDALNEAFKLVDPRHNKVVERSRTAFISFNCANGAISMSVFLARSLGFVSGDRIALINSQSNKFRWFIVKTNQRVGTKEVKISKGVFKFNSKKWLENVGESFRFKFGSKAIVRLYVNMEDSLTIPEMNNAKARQLFDIPTLREDFETQEAKDDYVKFMETNTYILKIKKDGGNQ